MARRRTKKTIKERVNKYLVEWADFLGLSQTWEIGVQIVDEIEGKTAGGYTSAAVVHVQLPYRRVEIEVGKCMEDHSDYDIERAMLHELVHIPLAPTLSYLSRTTPESVHNMAWDMSETVADFFTRALLRMKYGDKLPEVRLAR